MSYIFSGTLRAQSCGGEVHPLDNATLKLYRQGREGGVDDFAVRGHEELRDRDYLLFCQGRTDDNGEFRIDLGEKSVFGHRGSTHPYAGEAFTLEAIVRRLDGGELGHDPEPVQISLGTITLDWQQQGDDHTAQWDHTIPESEWSRVREALDAWSILGRVVRAGTGEGIDGLRVFAYDADFVKDDFLGTAETDSGGRFRINYSGSDFREPAGERGGPELYFRVETADGQVVLKEAKSRGNQPDRADASNCFQVELAVDSVPSAV
jgi:hypothetical protein